MKEITKSEKITALQQCSQIEEIIKESQEKYRLFREKQKTRLQTNINSQLSDEEFWQTVGENSPETRLEIARRHHKGNTENKTDVSNNSRKCLR